MTDVSQLIPGETYVIKVDDCCVTARTVATFVRYELDEDGDPHDAVFDTLTIGPMWGAWSADVAVRAEAVKARGKR